MSHDLRGRRRIPRHHHGAHAQRVQLGDEQRGIIPRRVAQGDEPDQLHRRRRSGGDRQHAEALVLKLLRRGCRGRRRRREADHGRESAFDDALRDAARVLDRRLGHFRRGVERHELDQLWRVGDGLRRGGGSNAPVHRVLSSVRTDQRGQSQNVRLVKTGHGVDGGHRQNAERVELATTSRSPDGCAGGPMRSITPTCWSLCNGFRRNVCDGVA